MYIYDLSRNIAESEPYEGDPQTEIEFVRSLEDGDIYNLSKFSMCTHTGTHIDAPFHYDEDGEKIGDIRLSTFYGKCSVISFSDYITGEDMEKILPYCKRRILFHGEGNAYLMSSAAQVIADSKVMLVGTDANSIATPFEEDRIHSILARSGICVIENLNLEDIKDGHDYTLCAFPIRLDECEAAPCRAILLEQEKGF
ncbi:MAG: cyclase family protein [Ruminococcus sp.]